MADDNQGLPDVDLGSVLDDLKSQDKDTKAAKATDTKTSTTKTDGSVDLGQFKTVDDLLKGYKEVQGFSTRVSQKNKELEQTVASIREELDLLRNSSVSTQTQMPIDKNFDQSFLEDPAGTIGNIVTQRVRTERIAEVLEDEAGKGREEFQERYAYAQIVAREYPNLTTTPAGVRKLFEKGDQLRANQLRKNAGKALETIFGEPLNDEEIGNLRSLVKGKRAAKTTQNSDAYMPDTSTSTKSGADTGLNLNTDSRMKESAQKGDVDGVIDALFEGILAE